MMLLFYFSVFLDCYCCKWYHFHLSCRCTHICHFFVLLPMS